MSDPLRPETPPAADASDPSAAPAVNAAEAPTPAATINALATGSDGAHVTSARSPWATAGVLTLAALCLLSVYQAWSTTKRVHNVEKELVRRQQDSQTQATEARLLARQTQDLARETAARTALLEARLAEVTTQRSQLDDLVQTLSRSRDENLVADIDAALRVAQQQAVLTGSAEPVVAALKTADERLARVHQPRLDAVRRAIARDLDRVRSQAVADVPTLTIKLDEVIRLVDEIPLLRERADAPGHARGRLDNMPPPGAGPRAAVAAGSAPAAGTAQQPADARWSTELSRFGQEAWDRFGAQVWQEVRSLIRVQRIENPEAMLLTPEHAFFLRENLKLKLLNARAALLSRQFKTAQGDLGGALDALSRYFDPASRKTQLARDLLRQALADSGHTALPRPDETTATLAALTGSAAR